MKNEEMKKLTEGIQEKLGDSADVILDDLGLLMADTEKMNNLLNSKDEKLNKAEQHIDMLQKTNVSLLQQVGTQTNDDLTGKQQVNESKEAPNPEAFNYRDLFDEYGNFKK